MDDVDEPIDGIDSVPPHRRETARARIAAIRRYLADPIANPARVAAADLGMTRISFNRLVRVWRAHADARRVMGGHHLPTQPPLPDAQARVIREAIEELPGAILERIAERAFEIGRERGIRMPGQAAVIKHVAIGTIGRIPDDLRAAGADIVVEHCVVDIGVQAPGHPGGMMPIATIVTRVDRPAVLGLSLALEAPTAASTASALGEAAARMTSANPPGARQRPVIYLQSLPGPDWDAIAHMLRSAGFDVIDYRTSDQAPPVATLRLLGRRPADVRLKPRLGRRQLAGRPAQMAKGATPSSLAEAENFLRARWIIEETSFVHLPASALERLRASFPDPQN